MNHELAPTNVLIIGCGIAGGTAALTLADAGVPVTVVTRARAPEDSNTVWAQGGIIYKGRTDTPAKLVDDILRAGAGHSWPAAARILADEGPDLVKRVLVERLGVPFARSADGALDVVMEGAHAEPRILHVADYTGRAIEIALLNVLRSHPNVTLLTGHTAIDLLTPSHHSADRLSVYAPRRCVGAYVFDRDTRVVRRVLARQTILATGGLGQIYLRTTNPRGARGDGLAMAYRAGARAINNEFIQFHPTTFHHRDAPHFLISEAVRGAGARLVHADGAPFMQKYDPEWRDLAPRDVVARSIYAEMLERDVENVYLDLRSHIAADAIRDHFPSIARQCADYGFDLTTDLIPVVPGAHYACGGVWVDEDGRTTIDDLYAVGEVACTGVHGANRLASTSLLEGLVWGHRSAQAVRARLAEGVALYAADNIPPWQYAAGDAPDPVLIQRDFQAIQTIMTHYVGLVRTTPRLARALRELRHLESEIEQFYRVSSLTDGLIGLRNAARAAILVAAAAWSNKRSMGAHYRE